MATASIGLDDAILAELRACRAAIHELLRRDEERAGPSPAIGDNRLAVGAREASRMLGVCAKTLWSLSVRGEIPSVKVLSRRLYPISALREWLNEKLREGGAD
jgi:hypothetical protein